MMQYNKGGANILEIFYGGMLNRLCGGGQWRLESDDRGAGMCLPLSMRVRFGRLPVGVLLGPDILSSPSLKASPDDVRARSGLLPDIQKVGALARAGEAGVMKGPPCFRDWMQQQQEEEPRMTWQPAIIIRNNLKRGSSAKSDGRAGSGVVCGEKASGSCS